MQQVKCTKVCLKASDEIFCLPSFGTSQEIFSKCLFSCSVKVSLA